MQIVIDIPEEIYKSVQDGTYCGTLYEELRHGTPLPKGHGDLIDRAELMGRYGLSDATKYGNETKEQQTKSYGTMMMYEIADMIDDAPTIIEADRGGWR